MKPFDILSALPQWADATPGQIIDSPAFSMPCRLGDESTTLVLDAVCPADTIGLSIMIEDEPHILSLARSPRFKELDAIWDSRADMPEPIILALVERDAGQVLQLVENAVRRQIRLVGLASSDGTNEQSLCAKVADVVFTLTRSATVTAAIGNLRNLDLSHDSVRSLSLPAVAEYAAFALTPEDIAGLAVGDALLLPEMGTVLPKLVVDRRFVLSEGGVSRYDAGDLVHVVDAESKDITLGEIFDAAESSYSAGGRPSGELRLVGRGKSLAVGRLENLADHPALVVEAL